MQLHDKNNIAENKLIILYMLYKFRAPLSFEFMYDYISENDWINYFDMSQLLIDLEEDRYLKKDGELYDITITGVDVLDTFRKRIPFSIRQSIESYASRSRTAMIEEMQITADYVQDSANEFPVTLEIYENKIKVFSMKITATSSHEAEQLCMAFRQKANLIYSNTLSMLAAEIGKQ